jgi:hypothetical protein
MCCLQSVHGTTGLKDIGDRLHMPCYLSRVDDRKIKSRKQRTDIGTYSFVNREQLPADTLGTLYCKPSNFRKRVRKVINEAKRCGGKQKKMQRTEVRWRGGT